MKKIKLIDYNNLLKLIIVFVCILLIIVNTIVIIGMNPDTDTFFLIETGRYIVENKTIPQVNIWNITEGLKIVIQQPLCCVLNYLWYSKFSFDGLWILAIIENCIIILLVNLLLYKKTKM